MKKSKSLADVAIRAMPYEMRLRNYEREKNELFSRIGSMTLREVAKAHADLVEKWRV